MFVLCLFFVCVSVRFARWLPQNEQELLHGIVAIRFFSIADDMLADPAVASGAFEEIWVNSLKFKYTSMLTKAISNEGALDLVLPVEQKSSLDVFTSLFDMCCKDGTTIRTEFIPLSIGLDGHGTRWPWGGLDEKLQELCNHPLVITDQMPIPPRAPRAKHKKTSQHDIIQTQYNQGGPEQTNKQTNKQTA